MNVRMAEEKDIPRIHELLSQVAMVHHRGRPDLFKYGQRKYTDEQLKEILHDPKRPMTISVWMRQNAGSISGGRSTMQSLDLHGNRAATMSR